MIEYCRGKIATYKLPREVELVKELPRTPTGKLLRRLLRQTDASAATVKAGAPH
ncbi:MAG: AMP-binding enzyme [Terriglobales bacterium]